MTPIKLSKSRTLDGEEVFRMYWTDMGSARSLVKVVKQLPTNPNTNRPYTAMAIHFSIYWWALENLEKSYDIFNKARMDEGLYNTLEEWEKFVQERCWTASKKMPRRFGKYLNRVGAKNLISEASV